MILIITLIFIAISLYSSNSMTVSGLLNVLVMMIITCNNIKGLGNNGGSGGPIKPSSEFQKQMMKVHFANLSGQMVVI